MVTLVLAVIAALVMGLLFSGDIVLTVVLVVIAVGGWWLLRQRAGNEFLPAQIEESPLSRYLFASGEAALIWLPVRLALGWAWINAGWEKLNNPAWMNGQALLGFWNSALTNAAGAHPTVGFDWYAGFLQTLVNANASGWFGPLIAIGEFVVGACLILGLFTGIAAFGAALMNLNYMLAGSAGVNPLYFLFGIFLIMAWRNAGWIGLDRWLLPRLGTPWHRGGVGSGTATSPGASGARTT
ncbi:MAG TPA: TQO small subunit DoxD [Phototrophicaceae bacterium]|nr:TQO small subunit DoxD [Phototrophicaceae bacterium]